MEDDEELLRRRDVKIAEVEADIEKLLTDKFQKLENVKRLDRMLRMEIDLMRNAKNLEAQLTTCNYTFYKSIISEIEKTENPTAVLKTFKRNDVSVTVDVVTKNPNVWVRFHVF
uniref:Uncharacterized protein n=1 Tax=Caenorhabditis japonica TaxID=281687 RepID=A0A8R1I493_CAEJA